MALHLMLRTAKAAVVDGWAGLEETLAGLPEQEDDLDWDLLYEVLFQDFDMLSLFNIELDGIEDPDAEQNQLLGVGDYRPQVWFETFLNTEPRDGRIPPVTGTQLRRNGLRGNDRATVCSHCFPWGKPGADEPPERLEVPNQALVGGSSVSGFWSLHVGSFTRTLVGLLPGS
jgi:hypothetical protein